MASNLSIPLTELLLRPSSLERFTKRGFETTDEIEESRAAGGINLLASELDVTLNEAAGLIREVQGCLGIYERSKANIGGMNEMNGDHVINTSEPHSDFVSYNNNKTDSNTPIPRQQSGGIVTAYDLLMKDDHSRSISGNSRKDHRHIMTFCRSIDNLLGGGIALGQVTEIAGLPGTGKTQLSIQLSVLARLPHMYGGVEGRTLYIDAEGSFVAERAYSMAEALYRHIHGRTLQDHGRRAKHDLPADFTTEGILDSIDVFRVHDEAALLATLYSLRDYIEVPSSTSSPQSTLLTSSSSIPVKLIVIDSLAFHFRAVIPSGPSYYVQRTKTLISLAAYLGDLARQYNLAVVVINQMTTKIGSSSNNSSSSISRSGGGPVSIVPALGESWAHTTATRLLLLKEERFVLKRGAPDGDSYNNKNADHDDENGSHSNHSQQIRQELRSCSLTKSAHRPNGSAHFRILEGGIRDVVDEHERLSNFSTATQNQKRSRIH